MAENQNRRTQQNRNPFAGFFAGLGGQNGGFGAFITAILALFTGGAGGLAGLFSGLMGNRNNNAENNTGHTPHKSLLQRGRDAISRGIDSGRELVGRGIDALKNLIGHHESRNDYNVVFGEKRMPLTNMTINQVLAWQHRYTENGSPSSAAGRYQIIEKTLRGLKNEMGLTGNEKFDAAMQDRMFVRLAQRRGLNDFISGRISEDRFMRNLSQEWASLPKDNSGLSYYHGDGLNRAHASPASVRAALDSVQNNTGVHYTSAARTGHTLATTPRISSQLNRVSAGDNDAPHVVAAAAPAPRQVPLMSPSPSFA